MSEKNKFSNHQVPSTAHGKNNSIEEEKEIQIAEDMLASPHVEKKSIISPKEHEIDKMIHSQSLSVIFQDLNDSQIAKFNKKQKQGLKEIPEDLWNDNRLGELGSNSQNLDNSKSNKREKLHHNSMSKVKVPETPQNVHVKGENNSIASRSARSPLRLSSPTQLKNQKFEKSDVAKDKLFSEEDQLINSKEFNVNEN